MFDGLETMDWSRLHGAYGPAGEVPGLVRAMAGADVGAAGAARRRLEGVVYHQGTTYSVSAPVVPFLAGMLMTGGVHDRGELAWLLGEMAAYNNQRTKHIAAVRAAVTSQVDRLLPLLDDPDAAVRAGVAFALSQCPKRRRASTPALRARFGAETEPQTKAQILAAAQWLEPKTDLVATALAAEQSVPVRAAAAVVLARSQLPWSQAATDAVRAGWADGEPLEKCWWWGRGSSPLRDLVAGMSKRDTACADVLAMLLASSSTSVREQAAQGSVWVMKVQRHSRAQLVPVLAASLTDQSAEVRDLAATALHEAGEAARPAADALAASTATSAASALLQLGDPRWRPLVTAGNILDVLAGIEVPYDPALGDALRGTRASDWENDILRLVTAWGPAAGAVVPRLLEEYRGYLVVPALAAIGPAAADALPLLRADVAAGDVLSTAQQRLAILHIAGDPEPALAAALAALAELRKGARLSNHRLAYDAVALLDGLGEHGWVLVPDVRALLEAHHDFLGLARTLWRWTGEPDDVIPTVRRVLELAAGQLRQRRPRYPGDQAAELAGELGDSSLVPLLRPLLADPTPRCRVPAAQAIWRLTGDNDGLIPPLLKEVTPRPPGHRWREAFALLAEMGQAATVALPQLRNLADHPWCPFVEDFEHSPRRGLGHHDDAFLTATRSTMNAIQGTGTTNSQTIASTAT